jgi:hypothetical protein
MKKKKLRIRTSYEKNRLAEIYLSNAYEKLISKIIRVIKERKNNAEGKIIQSFRGN